MSVDIPAGIPTEVRCQGTAFGKLCNAVLAVIYITPAYQGGWYEGPCRKCRRIVHVDILPPVLSSTR